MQCASWTKRACGILFVAPEGVLSAVVTDGDVRRYILRSGCRWTGPVREMANYQPKRAAHGGAGAGARPLLLEHAIGALPLLDKRGRVAGRGVRGRPGHRHTQKSVTLPVVIMAGRPGHAAVSRTPKSCPSP